MIALRMPRSPGAITSGRSSRNIRYMCALHSPRPLTATSSAMTVVVVELVEALELERAVDDVLGERAQVADLGAREAARGAQLLGVGGEHLRGRRRAAAEVRDDAQPDRLRRLRRELLADDRPDEPGVVLAGVRAVGGGGSLGSRPTRSISAPSTGSARRRCADGRARGHRRCSTASSRSSSRVSLTRGRPCGSPRPCSWRSIRTQPS